MMQQQKITNARPCFRAISRAIRAHLGCGRGCAVFACVLLAVSLFSGFNFDTGHRLYVAGQVAESNVVADRYLLVEDAQATAARRKQVMLLQPSVYDLSLEPYIAFETRLIDLMRELNGAPPKNGREDPSVLFSSEIGPELAREILPELGVPTTQKFVLHKLLPLLRERMSEGLVGDIRTARVGRSGVIIRNLDTGQEVLRPDVTVLPDVQSFLTEISTLARGEQELSHNARRAVNVLLSASLPATLTLNREATQRRASQVMDKVEPVYYQIQKGELIVRRGDRVSREQQIKLQALYQTTAMPLDWQRSLGLLILSLFISMGFFLSPSGRPGSSIRNKDLYLISIVVAFTTLAARGVYALGALIESSTLAGAFSVAFPMAGACGFVAMVFAARRYVTMGLLLSLFTAVNLHLGVSLGLFHFLSAMLTTWLVVSAMSRQDAVWNLIPLILGESFLLVGATFLEGTALNEMPMLFTAVCINSLLTLILFFSLSPVLETVFGYSTRFRLMEFISLEQPLMQEIMVTIPGTYHHSIVVANMVEAGARAIGANALLCKVAALYHDSGKLAYPQYYIENQFGGPNKHDKLSPSMSALIIMNHVKKGIELCQRYRLGQEITDIIAQHHGTRVIRCFYQKAIALGENPNESDYSYPGPKPQTKEAAILMLADSVEASSRTLTDPTPARLKAHVDKIIKGIFAEGQLDESELTFRDLHYLSESVQRVLTGIFHQRIAYPEPVKGMKGAEAAAPEQHFFQKEPAAPSPAKDAGQGGEKTSVFQRLVGCRRNIGLKKGAPRKDAGAEAAQEKAFIGPLRPGEAGGHSASVEDEHLMDGCPLSMDAGAHEPAKPEHGSGPGLDIDMPDTGERR